MDILFKNITVVTLDNSNTVLENAFVGVQDGKIAYVGQAEPPEKADRVIDGHYKVLMPGLCNAHTHVAMSLLRGYADYKQLQDWLFNYIFPAEEKLTAELVYQGSALGILEMIASGTVSFSDMYFFVPETAKAVAESGMKANLSRPLQCFEPEYDPKTDYRYQEIIDLAKDWHGHDNGRILIDSSVHAEYTSHPKVWVAAAELAHRLNLGMHTHLSETRTEHEECIARYGLTPAAVLDKHGLFSVRTTAAHCVWLTDEDIQLLASRHVTAVHNPVSNLKLASGVARLPEMRKGGLALALGTDSVASNNSHDMFEEIKLCSLLHPTGESSAAATLSLATRDGFHSQGRGSESGQISPGMDADLILIDFDTPALTPCYDPLSHLCHSARGSDVVLTMVRGKILYENGKFLTMDKERILYEARAAARIFSRD